MNRVLALLIAGWIAMAAPAAAQTMEMHVSLSGNSSLFANGDVIYTDFWGNYPAIDMTVELWIRDSMANSVASSGIEHVHTADYSLNVSGTGVAGECYTARLAASGGGTGNEVGSSQVCIQPPPPPPPPADQNGGNTDWSGTGSPIVLNLSDGDYDLSGLDDPVSFDITGDGTRERIGWTARGSSLAFLALDRNGNHFIDGGRELFGDATPLADGTRASNGFEALQQYDSNGDGRIDAADAIWSSLLLWTDGNHDGASTSSELLPAAQSDLRAIALAYHRSGRVDSAGNVFRYQSTATVQRAHGESHRPCYDIFFVMGK